MSALLDFLNDKSDQISTFPIIGIFFGEERLPFAVDTKRTSKTSCLVTLRLDVHKMSFLKSLVIGASFTTTTAELDNRKPDGVTEKKDYGELGTHYRLTVTHGDRKCSTNCAFSWELSEDAIRIPGAREFEVDVHDIDPPLNAPNRGSFEIAPFSEHIYLIQSSHQDGTPVEGCD
jgi:hypothetical protein